MRITKPIPSNRYIGINILDFSEVSLKAKSSPKPTIIEIAT
tara:strand:+ start:320 stop:442 length:123 start_codon:yes stop_codon:yes gene_type:complete